MPFDPAYIDLEMDFVEDRGAGRVPQETAKNPVVPGENVLPAFPKGIPRKVINAKRKKTKFYVDAEITQVLRGKEG
jgi:hypothetical protein